ncbi:MAG: signal peptide peptidase SppA [Bacteroidota bacterium]|nr:signal peptide peptidase SppA [Bacteroidota bacterium]
MKDFIKYTIATILGLFISFVFLGILLFFSVLGLVSSGGNKNVTVKSNSIIELDLDYDIQERSSNSFAKIFSPEMSESFIGLDQLLSIIEHAKNDDKIKGIYLKTNINTSGYAVLSEVRNALDSFKKSGKFIYAMASYYDEKNYYLASVADSVFIEKTGNILLNGLSANIMFYSGALEKLGVEMQYVKVGSYKGAIEAFTRKDLSPENREQISSYLNILYRNILFDMANGRKLDIDTLKYALDNFTIQSASDAKSFGLIDDLTHEDVIVTNICNRIKNKDKKCHVFIKGSEYMQSISDKKEVKSKDKIAIVYAVGEIMEGQGNDNTIGSISLSKAIRQAREDKHIKAIVLRVNSPGGSALASDIIAREISLCKGVKPVVVSMSDVAASGGYYISALADTIIALPNTLTGSIGVFGLFPNMQNLLNDKMGITFESVNTGKYSDFGRVDRPLSETDRFYLQKMVNQIYNDFTGIVENGRNIDSSSVEAIAQGRVWAASQAIEHKLVDSYGGIKNAISIAAFMSKTKDYSVVSYPKIEDPFSQFFNQSSNELMQRQMQNELGIFYHYYQSLMTGIKNQGFQMRLPFNLQIQ